MARALNADDQYFMGDANRDTRSLARREHWTEHHLRTIPQWRGQILRGCARDKLQVFCWQRDLRQSTSRLNAAEAGTRANLPAGENPAISLQYVSIAHA